MLRQKVKQFPLSRTCHSILYNSEDILIKTHRSFYIYKINRRREIARVDYNVTIHHPLFTNYVVGSIKHVLVYSISNFLTDFKKEEGSMFDLYV